MLRVTTWPLARIKEISFFSLVSARLGEQPRLAALSRPEARRAAREFFALKTDWPFRTSDEGRFGKYCLTEDEYREARIPYAEIGCDVSRYDAIFLSLASQFSSSQQIAEAERIIDQRIVAFVRCCE